jgi:U3 small nucleolar ribonucleoprotein protein LCP5
MQERTKKHMLSSSIMQDLREEYLDAPVEVSQTSRAQQILSKQQQEREEYEEEYMTRLPVSKSEKHKRRQLTTIGSLGDELTSFGATPKSGGKRKTETSDQIKREEFQTENVFH